MRTAPAHQVLSQDNMLEFLRVLRLTGSVTKASAQIGLSTTKAHDWYNRSVRDRKDPRFLIRDPLGDDPDTAFCDAWNEARAEARGLKLDAVRDNAFEIAAGLKRKPIIHQGKIAFEPDYTKEFKIDPLTGLVYYPPKIDPLTGEPVPLTVVELFPAQTFDYMKVQDPDFKPKSDIDVTTAGKPLLVPDRTGMTIEKFLERFGRKVEDE